MTDYWLTIDSDIQDQPSFCVFEEYPNFDDERRFSGPVRFHGPGIGEMTMVQQLVGRVFDAHDEGSGDWGQTMFSMNWDGKSFDGSIDYWERSSPDNNATWEKIRVDSEMILIPDTDD
jgi:hypothetical protein